MLVHHMAAVEAELIAKSRVPANAGHTLHRGTPREWFIRDFLESHLNSNVAIGSGEVIDANSQPRAPRNQFDIVIYKRSYPRLDFGGGITGFLAESVVATIEVKSILDSKAIDQAIGAAHAAKSLVRSESSFLRSGYVPPSILSYVVAYDGPTQMQTAHGWLKTSYASRGLNEPAVPPSGNRTEMISAALDGIFVLGRGFLNFDNAPYGFATDAVRQQVPGLRWVLVNSAEGSLLSLFMQITVATANLQAAFLNPLPYLAGFQAKDVSVAG